MQLHKSFCLSWYLRLVILHQEGLQLVSDASDTQDAGAPVTEIATLNAKHDLLTYQAPQIWRLMPLDVSGHCTRSPYGF